MRLELGVVFKMSNFDELKSKSKEEQLIETLNYLEETRFNFACFVDSFKRYLEKAGVLKE